jgi:hypothetical protein
MKGFYMILKSYSTIEISIGAKNWKAKDLRPQKQWEALKNILLSSWKYKTLMVNLPSNSHRRYLNIIRH